MRKPRYRAIFNVTGSISFVANTENLVRGFSAGWLESPFSSQPVPDEAEELACYAVEIDPCYECPDQLEIEASELELVEEEH